MAVAQDIAQERQARRPELPGRVAETPGTNHDTPACPEHREEGTPRNLDNVPAFNPSDSAYCNRHRDMSDLAQGVSGIRPEHATICTRMMSMCFGYEILDKYHLSGFIPRDGSLGELQRAYEKVFDAPPGALKHDLLIAAGQDQELCREIESQFSTAPLYARPLHGQPSRSPHPRVLLPDLGEELSRLPGQTVGEARINLAGMQEYYDRTFDYASQHALDPLFVLSLIRRESNFDKDATSVDNARGLLQILPSTAKDLDPSVTAEQLYDPDINLRLGCKYMADNFRDIHEKAELLYLEGALPQRLSYEDLVRLTVIAHNAGPGEADLTLQRFSNDYRNGNPVQGFVSQYAESNILADNVLEVYRAAQSVRDRIVDANVSVR